jgi:hypothetical protein
MGLSFIVEWCWQGKLLIRPPERSLTILLAEPSSNKLEQLGEKKMDCVYKISFHTVVTCRKILRHGADGCASPPKEGVLRIFITLKNPPLRPRLNINQVTRVYFLLRIHEALLQERTFAYSSRSQVIRKFRVSQGFMKLYELVSFIYRK